MYASALSDEFVVLHLAATALGGIPGKQNDDGVKVGASESAHPIVRMIIPLLAALPAALIADPAHAIDPNETQVTLPDQYQWKPGLPGAPAQSVETVPVFGATDKPGLYVVLIKWHPGFMSAPHTYVTDRLCFVISGTWWVNSGENFEPQNTVFPTTRSRWYVSWRG